MRITKAMLQEQIIELQEINRNLSREVYKLRNEVELYKSVSSRPDTAFITAQRIAESSAKLSDAAVQIVQARLK